MSNHPDPSPRLIAIDWGTSSLRAWLMANEHDVVDSRSAEQGIMQIESGGFETVYRELIGDWTDEYGALPVVACGMIGSRGGWSETAYVECPADLSELARHLQAVNTPPAPFYIVPGVIQHTGGNRLANVMRGEETQALGALSAAAELADHGRLIMPGTHCKWVTIDQGRLTEFTTYMTGELFAVLRQHSILGRPARASEPRNSEAAFIQGVDTARGMGCVGIGAALFSTRSRVMAGELEAEASLDYLSGLLIGDELRSALGRDDAHVPLRLIGDPALCHRYQRALARFDVTEVSVIEDAARHGLWQIATAAGLIPTAS
ncbi:MAG: 2-dehydro-3-deoxygalactonokinase [Salinisphaera sp.]|jgi:2-dehydro-3-deoxygalactonokinase|nr:2-dehydro-3-deoxygalactonokinase [Salinisphaera sp.]